MAFDKVEFLSKVHYVTSVAKTQVDMLDVMADNPEIPEELRVLFAKLSSTISLQSQLIAGFAEQSFEIQDQLEAIVAKTQPK